MSYECKAYAFIADKKNVYRIMILALMIVDYRRTLDALVDPETSVQYIPVRN